MDHPDARPAQDPQTDLDLEILDLLREEPQGEKRLVEGLRRGEERVGPEDLRPRLEGLASRGLARPSAGPHAAGGTEAPRTDLWEITEEGRALVEPQAGVASAPYDRAVGGEDEGGDRDAGFWVLVAIAVVTGACAAYALLTATGVLGGA